MKDIFKKFDNQIKNIENLDILADEKAVKIIEKLKAQIIHLTLIKHGENSETELTSAENKELENKIKELAKKLLLKESLYFKIIDAEI